jgi:quercetin dioxygenase-like cupin family protein/catechol 2,3-dioxygenase-like lactoylglutathione lyase family enzyme
MTVTHDSVSQARRQVATDASTGRAWWFLGTLAVLRNPPGAPRTPAVIEMTVPPGGSPPRHVHRDLEDAFYLLDGELVLRCGDETRVVQAGGYVVVPRGVEHTFRVTSRGPARLLLIHGDDSFLQLIEDVGTPTSELRLPPPDAHTALDADSLERAIADHDAAAVGPPLEAADVAAYTASARDAANLGPINHVALQVSDVARSAAWYTQAFGLIQIDGEIGADGRGHVALLSPTGGWVLALSSAPVPGVEHIAFTCDDRDALVRWRESLPARGVEPGTLTDAPYGSGFVCRDPDGIEVELFAPAPMPG